MTSTTSAAAVVSASATAAAAPSAWVTFACGGAAACIAELVTLPIDTAKVRLQLLQRGAASASAAAAGSSAVGSAAAGAASAGAAAGLAAGPAGLGMVGALRLIVREEGARALYKGLWPAVHRQLVFASLRMGLYKEISALFLRPGETSVSLDRKILSGLLSGAIGMTVANPTDLVKVRMQSDRARPGQAPRYAGVLAAYTCIVRAEGLRGLWTGLGPAVLRNSVINATELASYETAKEALLRDAGMRDGVAVQAAAGAAAGVMATIVGNPVDVIKTRVMAAQAAGEAGAGAPRYRGALDCLVQTLRQEGPLALYQGVTPMFVRLTGWSIVMFLSFEQLKLAVGRLGVR